MRIQTLTEPTPINPEAKICHLCERCRKTDLKWNPDGSMRIKDWVCPACLADEGYRRVKAMFPPLYRDTDKAKLPCQDGFHSVMTWKVGPKGLFIIGAPGTGKSRSAWYLCGYHLIRGLDVEAMNGFKFNQTVLKYGRDDESFEFMDRLVKVPMLLLDDVFKCKLTERVEEQLFMVIEERMLNMVPTIITANDTCETLMARLSPDRGEPLVRRIIESSETIVFK